MRARSTLWRSALALLAALLLLPAAATAAPGKRVRVFAMGPKLNLSWLESTQTFRAKVFALADRRLRGPGTPLVQRGSDDFASHRLGPSDPARPVETARDLVLWPESLGLFAALTGSRGAGGRASGSLEGSIASLVAAYAPQNAYYAARYPALAGRVAQTRLLALALMDTFGRAVVEPFSEMADRYDVWLEVGVDMPQRWRVVCTDMRAFNAARRLPGGVRCEEQNAAKVLQLRDPGEPTRDYAYEAATPDPSVMALVFDPAGRLVGKRTKSYLVPTELGPAEGQLGLDLVPGAFSDSDARPLQTPVGRLGFVISKPAWMPDVVQKLDQQRVDLLVQPEFFVQNLTLADGHMWNPDVLRASGYNAVLRHPSFEALVLPEMVGGVFNFYADHQQHIAVKPRRRAARGGQLVGQPRAPGMVSVMPWVVPDPVRPAESVAQRRRRLGEAGRKLAPGSGVACPDPAVPGPCEDGHVEGVLWRDVTVSRRPRYKRFRRRRARTRFSRSRPARRARRPQRNAAPALRGRRGVLAYEERRAGRDQILLVRTRTGGRKWTRPVRPTGRRRGSTDEWWPSVAMGPGRRVTVAWMDRSSGRERVYFARSRNGGRSFGAPRPLDPSPPSGVAQWKPALARGAGDTVHAVFVDERARQPDGGLPQAGAYYTRIRNGVPEKARRLDGGSPAPLATKLDNAWAPSVAARGRGVLVAWLDFRRYDWDVFSRRSRDGGQSFGTEVTVNDTPDADEALNDSPRAAFAAGRPLVAWTDWRKRDTAALRPHAAYDTYLSEPGAANRQADPYADRPVSTFSPAICAGRRDALVAFQDAGTGQNDIRIVRMRSGTRRGRARRVDDAGRRGGNAWRPQIACSGGRVLVAWEDERDGPAQIYTAFARSRRIR